MGRVKSHILEILTRCDEQVRNGRNHIYLDIGKRRPGGEHVRLSASDRKSPRGSVCSVNHEGHCIALFDPRVVAEYLRSEVL